MTPKRAEKINAVLSLRQPDLTLIADCVHKARNLAAIVRSCDAVGVGDIHAVMSADEFKPYRGTAMGSNQWVDMHIHNNSEQAIVAVKQQGMQLIVADSGDKNGQPFDTVDYTCPTAIVMGGEIDGVSAYSYEQADALIYIPMVGMVESFNVSVAAAIILNEARAQRQRAGLYQQTRINHASYQRLFFRWGYPRLANFCDSRGIPYPTILSNGDIDDPEGRWRREAKALEVAPEC